MTPCIDRPAAAPQCSNDRGRAKRCSEERSMYHHRHPALLLALTIIASTLLFAPSHAQPWPTKPIRWLVPVAPGGATDVVARFLQAPIARRLNGQIIVENRTGGAGMIATQAAVTSPPDGT